MRFKFASALLLLGFAYVVVASPQPGNAPQNDVPADITKIESDVLRKLNTGCASRETNACLKLKMLAYMNKLMKKASIELTEDVVLTQTAEVPVFVSSPRELTSDDEDSKLFSLVTGKARSFLQSRELHWKVLPDAQVVVSTGREAGNLGNLNVRFAVDTARATETARTKIKGLFALIAAGIAKIGIIAALKFAGLVALVFKAVVVSKLALALSVIVGLVKLLSSQQHAVTYEVVSHPHIGHSSGVVSNSDTHHDSYSSSVGYGRSGAPVDNLAYNAHVPK